MTIQKRFIAGAVCPRCGEMDRLVTYTQDEAVYKECVSCGFEEKQIAQVEQGELPTRVNQFDPSSERDDEQVEAVKILPPSK